MKNNEEEYYQIRKSRPRTEVGRAARLIYLVTLSFNGIYRVNLAGNFNVPYGYKRHINVCQPDAIHLASKLLQRTEVICSDFAEVVADAAKGDFVYFDPPYTVNGAVNGFRKYNARLFSWDDQVRLASVAIDLAQRGCHVLVSNANHPEVRDLYNGFVVKNVQRFSRIAALSKHRRIITEYLFFSERR